MALGNDLVFGVLRGLRVVERPRSGGPLRKVGAPAPASGSPAADASSYGTSASKRPFAGGEKLQLSPEARAMAALAGAQLTADRREVESDDARGDKVLEVGTEVLPRLPVGGLLA